MPLHLGISLEYAADRHSAPGFAWGGSLSARFAFLVNVLRVTVLGWGTHVHRYMATLTSPLLFVGFSGRCPRFPQPRAPGLGVHLRLCDGHRSLYLLHGVGSDSEKCHLGIGVFHNVSVSPSQ